MHTKPKKLNKDQFSVLRVIVKEDFDQLVARIKTEQREIEARIEEGELVQGIESIASLIDFTEEHLTDLSILISDTIEGVQP